ncbi:hypothetical protein AURDEDRAFT_187489 [Auricularia subglabra TFB-10046 SS5]|nr:hypothetical protein AURDEDRAFT_187489 [Auricularia subglabra TFB-10046 SS5]
MALRSDRHKTSRRSFLKGIFRSSNIVLIAGPRHEGTDRTLARSKSPVTSRGTAGRVRQTRSSAAEELRVENDLLREELQDVKRRLKEAQSEKRLLTAQHHDDLEQVKIVAHEKEQELRDELARSAKDLTRLRSLTTGACADVQALLTLFDSINDEIGNFAFRLVRNLSLGDRTVGEICVYAHECASTAANGQYLDPFLTCAEKRGCSIADTLVLAIQGLFVLELHSQVFVPFLPGSDDDVADTLLKRLEHAVKSQECQEYSARWRAMTYKAVAVTMDQAFPTRFAEQLVQGFEALFVAFDLDTTSPESASSAVPCSRDAILEIVSMAVQWLHQARTAHFDYDYRPFLPSPKLVFQPDDMEREGWPRGEKKRIANRKSSVVILPLTLGLEAIKAENASVEAPWVRKVVRKSRVL